MHTTLLASHLRDVIISSVALLAELESTRKGPVLSLLTTLKATVGKVAEALEGHDGSTQVNDGEINPYVTNNLPSPTYDTVLGFLAKTNPEALDLMGEPAYDTQRDGFWLTAQAKKRGLVVHKVDAPSALQELGIVSVNAYPVALLVERLG